jgi:hypothetical protein
MIKPHSVGGAEMQKSWIRTWTIGSCAVVVGYFLIGCILLPFERAESRTCLPSKLQDQPHGDYLPGLRWIPRSATSWCMVQPPKMVMGSQTNDCVRKGLRGPEAIPARGQWQLSFVQVRERLPFFLPYFAITTKNGWHWRIGCRWDQSDGYYSFPSGAIKKLR